MNLRRVCLVVAIALAPSTTIAQRQVGPARPGDPHSRAVGGRGAVTPKPAGSGDHRAVPSQARRRGQRILAIPLLVDSNEVESGNEDATPPPSAPPGPAVESSSIQPPFQPATTANAAQGSLRGNLRLDVEPHTAQVYVDGFYLGTVEDSHRSPAGLTLATGWHRLEFRAPGFETPAINVTIEPNRTTSYQGTLKPARP
jgi:hypothetical protein